MIDDDDRLADRLPLDGRTRADAYRWLASVVLEGRAWAPAQPLIEPDYALPPHPTAEGSAFVAGPLDAELAHWYANADRVLTRIANRHDGASPVRCWPHHFDIAALIVLDPERDPEEARSVGVGMTPGDAGRSEPYWYVTPWPYPAGASLPALAADGRWQTDGWIGAVLPAGAMTTEDAGSQEQQVTTFLDAGVNACLALLGA